MSSAQNTAASVDSMARGIIGRVFTTDDVLHCIVGVDATSGMVELNCHKNRRTSTVHMPLAEVCLRLG
ncbi:MAG: hypothetical protein IH908_13830 [Proteobacteria bacterium]|nr:hypothetical protein [Pseudomonadota bacterium]